MSLSSLLDQSLNLERQAVTLDGSGGALRTFSVIASNLACSVAPAGAAVVADYGRRQMVVDHRIYTTADLDHLVTGGVQLTDRFTDGAAYYLVKAVKKSANRLITSEVLYEVDCERRQ